MISGDVFLIVHLVLQCYPCYVIEIQCSFDLAKVFLVKEASLLV